MAAKLGTVEGNLAQAELLEARTGIPIKEMQGVRAWNDEETGKFGIEILHPYKTGLLSRTRPRWQRLELKPRPDGKPVSFEIAQRIAAHMDGFVRDHDYVAPKEKKQKTPKVEKVQTAKPAEPQPKPKQKPANDTGQKQESRVASWFKRAWPFGRAKKQERQEPTFDANAAAEATQQTVNPVLTDEKALTKLLAQRLATAPELIQEINLTHNADNTAAGYMLNVTIAPLEGLTKNPSINDISIKELLGHEPQDLDINAFAQTVFKANEYVKTLHPEAQQPEPETPKTEADADASEAEVADTTNGAEAANDASNDADISFEQALATISNFPKEMAADLGVAIPQEQEQSWKDLTGGGHLYIRGAAAPLLRIHNAAHDADAANAAAGTVGFANKKPEFFPGEHAADIAKLASTILDAEKAGKSLKDTLNAEQLALVAREVNQFSAALSALATQEGAPDFVQAYAKRVEIVNTHFQQQVEQNLKAALSANGPANPAQDGDALNAEEQEQPPAQPKGNAADAVAILCDFPREMAESLGTTVPDKAKDAWRDITGSGHVFVRGTWASLERIANGAHDKAAADAAFGTIGYARKAPENFLGDNAAGVAAIGAKILEVEKNGGSVADAVTAEEIELLKTELEQFNSLMQSGGEKAPEFIQKYSAQLSIVTAHYQKLAPSLLKQLEQNGPQAANDPGTPETANKEQGGDIPSFLKPGAKTMDERVAEHQAKQAAAKPKRETDLMKAANAVLLKQKNIDVDDVLDADPNKVFEKIDQLDLKAEGTKFESVEQIKQALKDLKAHRIAVRAKHAFSTDNVEAMAARAKENAFTEKKLACLNTKIDALDPEAVENIDIPLPLNGKDRVITVTYKNPETEGPKRITIPYSRGAKASIDSALGKLREKFGEVSGHDHVCEASRKFIAQHARENGGVADEYKIDLDRTDELGLIHFGEVLNSQIKPPGVNMGDIVGVNANDNSTLDYVRADGSFRSVKVDVNRSIFRSTEDMAEALNRALEHERFMKAAAQQAAPSADAA